MVAQTTFLGRETPRFDESLAGLRRLSLGRGAWLDHLPGWLRGHQVVFDALASQIEWRATQRPMYDRVVEVPRLVASIPDDGPLHPVLRRMSEVLSARYGVAFDRHHMAWYRDGRDSVAWHGDRIREHADQSVVAILSLGGPRKFMLRPVEGGTSLKYSLGWGDLLVMGGTCQTTWQHCVPKVRAADPRISIMFRTAADYAG